jgi:hypothetical protein
VESVTVNAAEWVTDRTGKTASEAEAEYAAGIKKIKDVMKRAGGSMKGMTS